MMSAQRFRELAEAGYNRIPVTREVLADLDTPLSTYLKLADEPWTFLLESVQGGEKWGRYSIIGLPCQERIEVRGFRITHVKAGEPPQDHEEADPWPGSRRSRGASGCRASTTSRASTGAGRLLWL